MKILLLFIYENCIYHKLLCIHSWDFYVNIHYSPNCLLVTLLYEFKAALNYFSE